MAVTWYLETSKSTGGGILWYEKGVFLSGEALRRAWAEIEQSEYITRLQHTLMYNRFYEGLTREEEKEKTEFNFRT
jgi:hypothetical protein